jgi:hypothetical protein
MSKFPKSDGFSCPPSFSRRIIYKDENNAFPTTVTCTFDDSSFVSKCRHLSQNSTIVILLIKN